MAKNMNTANNEVINEVANEVTLTPIQAHFLGEWLSDARAFDDHLQQVRNFIKTGMVTESWANWLASASKPKMTQEILRKLSSLPESDRVPFAVKQALNMPRSYNVVAVSTTFEQANEFLTLYGSDFTGDFAGLYPKLAGYRNCSAYSTTVADMVLTMPVYPEMSVTAPTATNAKVTSKKGFDLSALLG